MSPMVTSIRNSSLAVSILNQLAQEEEGDYTKNIADNLDKPLKSVSRLIKALFFHKLIDEGKRTRAQYYQVSPRGIANYWLKLIQESYEEIDFEQDKEAKRNFENLKEEEDEIIDFLAEYFAITLKSDKIQEDNYENTLGNLLFESLQESIYIFAEKENTNYQEHGYLTTIIRAIRDYKDVTPHWMEVSRAVQPEEHLDDADKIPYS